MKKSIFVKVFILIVLIILFLISQIKDFSSIIDYKYKDIETVKHRHPGNGVLYTSSDKDLIEMFVSIMDSSKYFRVTGVIVPSVVGGSGISLYSSSDNEIARIYFVNGRYVSINGKYYIVLKEHNQFKEFYELFLIDENISVN